MFYGLLATPPEQLSCIIQMAVASLDEKGKDLLICVSPADEASNGNPDITTGSLPNRLFGNR